MPLKQFKEQYGGDITSVLMQDMESRLANNAAAMMPATSLRTRGKHLASAMPTQVKCSPFFNISCTAFPMTQYAIVRMFYSILPILLILFYSILNYFLFYSILNYFLLSTVPDVEFISLRPEGNQNCHMSMEKWLLSDHCALTAPEAYRQLFLT